jgi:hypothetical protein
MVNMKSWTFNVPARQRIVQRIHGLRNEQLATRLSGTLVDQIPQVYIEQKNSERAKQLARLAYEISGSRMSSSANNVGYLYMVSRDIGEASLWFKAAEQYGREEDAQLLKYNMGVLACMTGELDEAVRLFSRSTSEALTEAGCVLRVDEEGGSLVFNEVFDPASIGDLAKEAIELVTRHRATEAAKAAGGDVVHFGAAV